MDNVTHKFESIQLKNSKMTSQNHNTQITKRNEQALYSWKSDISPCEDNRKFFNYCKTGDNSYLSDMSHTSQLNATLHTRDREGNSPLMLTIIHQQMQPFLSILRSLSLPSLSSTSHSLNTLSYLHLCNRHGHNALHLSLIFTNHHMLTALIQAGCDPLKEDREQQNAFHYIAKLNLIGFSHLIHSALVNKHNNNNKIVREIERTLLTARDSEGMTPVHRAIETHQQLNLVRELMNPGETETMEDREMRGDVVRVLTGKSSSSALHLAAATGNGILVEYILIQVPFSDRSEFVELSNGHGDTALHTVVAWDRLECVQCLLLHGSCVDVWNGEEELPLDYCL